MILAMLNLSHCVKDENVKEEHERRIRMRKVNTRKRINCLTLQTRLTNIDHLTEERQTRR